MAAAAPEYWFYHLQRMSLEETLPELLEKSRARGWRVLIKCGDIGGAQADPLGWLDEYLWTYRKNSFLPHGRDDEPLADAQPILLSRGAATSEGFDICMLTHGADIEAAPDTQRVLTFIDDRSEESKARARVRWRSAKAAGQTASYWKDNGENGWQKVG